MARLLLCIALLLFAAGAYGEDESSISPSPVFSNTSSAGPTPPSSSSIPLPTSAPTVVNYTIYNETNYPCVMMSGAIQIRVGYNLSNQETLVPVSVLDTTNYNGLCSPSLANITLEGTYPADTFLYNITFIMQDYKQQWNVSDVKVKVNLNNTDLFKNNVGDKAKSELTANTPNPAVFSPSLDDLQSYSCDTNMNYTMTVLNGAGDTYNLTLSLSDFKLQAFQFSSKDDMAFGKAQKCPNDIKGSKIVPIAVGIALAGLVLIVIVAYIVGRLRSRKQNSYEALS